MTQETERRPVHLTLSEALDLQEYYEGQAESVGFGNQEAADCYNASLLLRGILRENARQMLSHGVTIHMGSAEPAPEGSPVVDVPEPKPVRPRGPHDGVFFEVAHFGRPHPGADRPLLGIVPGRRGAYHQTAEPDDFTQFMERLTARAPHDLSGIPHFTLQDVEWAAFHRFGNLTDAARWMDAHLHALQHQTPRRVAQSGAEGCARVLELLADARH